MKEIFVLGVVNFFLLITVIVHEIYQLGYYKENSSEAELKAFNDLLFEKLKLLNINRYQSWRNPIFNETEIQIVILTKHRKGIEDANQYFHLTVESVLKSIIYAKQSYVTINICNLNGKRESYLDKWKELNFTIFTSPNWLRDGNVINQETLHYLWCMKQIVQIQSSASSFIIFEDDIELDETRFFPVLNKFTRELYGLADYALKFYHPPRLTGFVQPEPSRILELLAISLIFYFLVRISLNSLCNRRQTGSWFFVISLFSLCVNVTLLISRERFLHLRKLHKDLHLLVPAPFCCTPGMLFSRSLIEKLTKDLDVNAYLNLFSNESKDVAIDSLLYDYLIKNVIPYFYIEPNLINHFGRVSTLRDPVDPRAL